MYVHGYVKVKRGWGFGGLCRNIAEDELASHYR